MNKLIENLTEEDHLREKRGSGDIEKAPFQVWNLLQTQKNTPNLM